MVASVEFYKFFLFINFLTKRHNENHENTVAVIWDHCFKKIVRNVPLNWSKVASKFPQFTNNHICVEVTGKRVNRSVKLGLKIPANYFLWRCKSNNMAEK